MTDTSTSGYRAECADCPTTVGDYGEKVYVGAEFLMDAGAKAAAHFWATTHSWQNEGHRVRVSRFTKLTLDMSNVQLNPEVWKAITGESPTGDSGPRTQD